MVVAIGVVIAIGAVVGLTLLRPVLFTFVCGGLVVLIPTVVMRDPKPYWLFLLALSIPFDVSKRVTTWLVEPWMLYHEFGLPASGTLSLDFYLTDVILVAMLVPWLARLSLRRETFYFPKIGYIFVLYLAWALFVSLIEATSFYLAIFEWLREVLYFIAFLYLINNVTTRSQFRAITLALLIGLVISAGTVIVFFSMGIGTDSVALGGLYRQQENASETAHDTLYEQRSGEGSHTKRSSGLFVHPAHAAYYFEYILPIVLAYIVATRRRRDRLLFSTLFAVGLAALYMTFSRSGLVGLLVSCIAFIGIARWSELISRRAFARCCLAFTLVAAVSTPVLIHFLTTRPETITKRMELLDTALATYWQRPVIGAGLNNSSAVTEGAQSFARMAYGTQLRVTVVHNHYLVVLIEVGIVGFVLFFAFFWQTILTAFRHLRPADPEMRVLLAGIVSAMGGIAIHNFGDPFGGHVVQAMLWLYTALVFAICRRVRAEAVLPPAHRAVRSPS